MIGEKLGKTVEWLLDNMSTWEFHLWSEFYQYRHEEEEKHRKKAEAAAKGKGGRGRRK